MDLNISLIWPRYSIIIGESNCEYGDRGWPVPFKLLNAIIKAPLFNVYTWMPVLLFGKDVGFGVNHVNPITV